MEENDWLKPRTIFATMFYSTFIYLIIQGTEVPAVLNTMVSTLFGFYYGQKTQNKQEGETK